MTNREMRMRNNAADALQATMGVDDQTARLVAAMAIRSHAKRNNMPLNESNVSLIVNTLISENENAKADYKF